jgi:hypothetical protein
MLAALDLGTAPQTSGPSKQAATSSSSSGSSGRLSPGDVVDVLWALSMLGRPLPGTKWQAGMTRLTNRWVCVQPAYKPFACLLTPADHPRACPHHLRAVCLQTIRVPAHI